MNKGCDPYSCFSQEGLLSPSVIPFAECQPTNKSSILLGLSPILSLWWETSRTQAQSGACSPWLGWVRTLPELPHLLGFTRHRQFYPSIFPGSLSSQEDFSVL